MNLKNRTFTNNLTGESVTIIDSFQDIAITDKKERIDARRLVDPNFYTEEINPDNFMNTRSTYDMFAQQIKSVDLKNVPEEDVNLSIPGSPTEYQPATNESAVYYADEDDEIEELKRKYGASEPDRSAVERQNAAFDKLLNPDSEQTEVVQRSQPRQEQRQAVQKQEFVQPDQRLEPSRPVVQPKPIVDDPMVSMFKNTKRSVDFNVSIDIKNRIPRLDFIEMMEDSYSVSIIEYLADEFLNDILKDPNIIRQSIIDKIREMVGIEEEVEVKQEVSEIDEEKVGEKEMPPEPPKDRKIVEGEMPPEPPKEKKSNLKYGLKSEIPQPPKDRKIVEGEDVEKPKLQE